MKSGTQAIIMKINEDAQQHGHERYMQIKEAIDQEIDNENLIYHEDADKQREVLRKHSEHEYARRLEYQRSRLNREMLVYQHELTNEIFDMAVAKLRDLSEKEFFEMLSSALKGLTGSFVLHLGELSRGKLDEYALEKVTEDNAGLEIVLCPATMPDKSGFVIRNERVEYDHLFENLVEDIKSRRTAEIMREVFGNSGDWMFA